MGAANGIITKQVSVDATVTPLLTFLRWSSVVIAGETPLTSDGMRDVHHALLAVLVLEQLRGFEIFKKYRNKFARLLLGDTEAFRDCVR
jgi:hypothetical protein